MSRIAGLRGRPSTGQWFDDLPLPLRLQARRWFQRFCARWGRNLPLWRRAILVGRARWFALHPCDSAWGRSMLAKRGGKARQRQARLETYPGGRTLQEYAAYVRHSKAQAVKRTRQPGFRRSWFTNLDGI